jgi:N-acyl-D-aspartate/D-glutamate deacylase
MSDLVLRGGTIVDGTGAPAFTGDVVVNDGRVVAVTGTAPRAGTGDTGAATVVDVEGLVVAPGFVDVHTHYDAQLLWDPTASPSPLHGVTTVFGGNCGFALAPASSEHADYLARLMARVEGIPLAALEAGVPWDWTSYGDYLSRFDGRIAVNAGFLAGHSAMRRMVMAERASTDAATESDVAAMEALLREALDAGALGFSTSRASTHNDGDGVPVPSRHASDDELLRLAAVLGDFDGTQLELIVQGCLNGFTDDEVTLLAALSRAADSPVNWNVLSVRAGGNHDRQLEASTRVAELGGRMVALTLPGTGGGTRLSFLTGFALDGLPGWRETLGLPVPARIAALGDPEVRLRLAAGARSPEAGVLRSLAAWDRMMIVETDGPHSGRMVGELAAETGASPFDTLLDIVVADALRTGFSPVFPPEPDEVWEMRGAVWRDPRTVIGGSDAGAHLDMMCGAVYSTYLLGVGVRERGLLTIEEAVHQLSDVPARLYGLRGMGRIAEGSCADLVVFDPATVGPLPSRTRDDLPGGASRLYAEATGMHHVYVNGVEICADGRFSGATPGRLLRRGADTV